MALGVFKLGSPLKLQVAAGDPGAAESGEMYYNSTSQLFRVYENGAWQNLASRAYADSIAAGFDPKPSVTFATTGILPSSLYNNGVAGVGATITATANGALTVDSNLVSNGQRILVKDQNLDTLENGIYVVTQAGDGSNPFILTRATDCDGHAPEAALKGGDYVFVAEGNAYISTAWVVTAPSGTATIGTDAIVWTQVAGSASSLQSSYLAGNTITTSASPGNLNVAGTEKLSVTAQQGVTIDPDPGAPGAYPLFINTDPATTVAGLRINQTGTSSGAIGFYVEESNSGSNGYAGRFDNYGLADALVVNNLGTTSGIALHVRQNAPEKGIFVDHYENGNGIEIDMNTGTAGKSGLYIVTAPGTNIYGASIAHQGSGANGLIVETSGSTASPNTYLHNITTDTSGTANTLWLSQSSTNPAACIMVSNDNNGLSMSTPATAGAVNGNRLLFRTGDCTGSGNSGDVLLETPNMIGTGASGAIRSLTGNTNGTLASGDIELTTGATTGNAVSGSLYFNTGGTTGTADAGGVYLQCGNASGATANGGDIHVYAGFASGVTSGRGGDVVLQGGGTANSGMRAGQIRLYTNGAGNTGFLGLMESGCLRFGSGNSAFTEQAYGSLALPAAATTHIGSLDFDTGTFQGCIVEYTISSASGIRVGHLYVCSDGTNVSMTDNYTETADADVSWAAAMSGSIVQLSATVAGAAKDMEVNLRRFL